VCVCVCVDGVAHYQVYSRPASAKPVQDPGVRTLLYCNPPRASHILVLPCRRHHLQISSHHIPRWLLAPFLSPSTFPSRRLSSRAIRAEESRGPRIPVELRQLERRPLRLSPGKKSVTHNTHSRFWNGWDPNQMKAAQTKGTIESTPDPKFVWYSAKNDVMLW
jgi:hypothetical protein